MIDRTYATGAVFLAFLLLGGCCCPPACPPTACDPLREIGIDCRGLTGDDASAPQVFLDMTIARVPEGRVEQALGAYLPQHAGIPKSVPADRVPALVAAWRSDPAVEITSAPKMLVLSGQRASVFVGETVGFGTTKAATNEAGGLEFSIEEDPDGPVQLGMQIFVVVHTSADGSPLSLGVEGVWRETRRAVSPEGMSAAEFRTHVREHRLDTAFAMPDDGWVVMGDPDGIETEDGRILQVVLLHARWLDGSEAVLSD